MAFTTGDNNFGTAKWIVDATAGQGTHTTIASALTAASSGQTIFIRPGTYTENLTLKAGVNLAAYQCDSLTPNVTIVGKASFSSAGTVSISGIRLQTNSDFVLAVTGSAASIVNLVGCYLNLTNNTGISFTTSNTAADVVLINCQGNLGTTGIGIYSMSSTGTLGLESCYFTNSGASLTASSNSAGLVDVLYCTLSLPISCSSAGGVFVEGSIVDSSATNTTAITTTGTGISTAGTSQLTSGTASTISIGAGTTFNAVNSSVNSSNANAITGTGTLNYTDVYFVGSSAVINSTLTITAYKVSSPSISSSNGSQAISIASAGDVTIPVRLGVGSAGPSDIITASNSTASTGIQVAVRNTSNTASSFAAIAAVVGGASADDPISLYQVTGGGIFTAGIDNSDSDKYKIAPASDVGTNSSFIITSAGQVTMPLQPCFFGYLANAVTNVTGDGTLYTVVFDATSFNVGSSYATGTGAFTAPVAGKYRFNAQLLITGLGVQSSAQVQIVASGTSYVSNIISPVAVKDVNSQVGLSIATVVNMAAGDTAVVKVVLSGSTKTNGVYGEATVRYSYFAGELIS